MYTLDLSGRNALVFGVANQRSIAWHIARTLDQAGARIALSYINDRVRRSVERLGSELSSPPILVECDVSDDANVEGAFESLGTEMDGIDIIVHSIAFANREDLGGPFIDTPKGGLSTRARHKRLLAGVSRKTRRAHDEGQGRQHHNHDLPGFQPRVPGLQRNGHC